MRKLKIDLPDLELAFDSALDEGASYLDLETGQVVFVTAATRREQVEAGYGTRCVAVPRADSHVGYRDMEDFIETVQDERLQSRLWHAIQGRGAFRRFKDVLAEYRREEQRWYEFRDARERQLVTVADEADLESLAASGRKLPTSVTSHA